MKGLKELIVDLIPYSKQHHSYWHYLNKRLCKCKVSKNYTYKPRCRFEDWPTETLEGRKLCPRQKIFGGLPKNE